LIQDQNILIKKIILLDSVLKILALIPARKNSVRLPGKNKRLIGKLSLVENTFEHIKNVKQISKILISTDDSLIRKKMLKRGALVPWLRPKKLSTSSATSADVALHALKWFEKFKFKVDGVLLFQPTTPFREKKKIIEGIQLFKKNKFKKVLGVSTLKNFPTSFFKGSKKKIEPILNNKFFPKKNLYFRVNGSFYLISPKELKSKKSFIKGESVPLIIDNFRETIDIDTKNDFLLAKKFLS